MTGIKDYNIRVTDFVVTHANYLSIKGKTGNYMFAALRYINMIVATGCTVPC